MALVRRTSKRLYCLPLLGLGLGGLLALASCTKDRPPGSDPGGTTMPPPPGANPTASPGVAATPPSAKPASPATAEPPGDTVSGTVLETMNSGGYTYARLDEGGKEVWVAGPETKLSVGARIGKASGMVMSGFKSTTLNRTFDQIYFIGSFEVEAGGGSPNAAVAASAPASPHAPDMAGSAMPNPHGASAPASADLGEKIEPAAGGKTVADIFAGKDALSGKPVVVRGKVVKVNNGILGRNWVHLQDGTGAAGTSDLMVTTSATVTKGDVVVARGTLATNKDFGAGYSYPVLVEDAKIDSK